MVITTRIRINQYGCQFYPWSDEKGKYVLLCSCSRLKIWSREVGLVVPSHVSPLIRYTEAESGTYSRAPSLLLLSATSDSPEFIASRSCLPTNNGVNCRESAGTGPVVFKVLVQVMGAAYSGNPMDQFSCDALFPQRLLARRTFAM